MTEATGRGFTQDGAGEFPLSEIETRAVVLFLLSHPNVSIANSMDTSVPMHLRPPSTSPSDERMYPDDLALYKTFDQKGKEITGYARAGDWRHIVFHMACRVRSTKCRVITMGLVMALPTTTA